MYFPIKLSAAITLLLTLSLADEEAQCTSEEAGICSDVASEQVQYFSESLPVVVLDYNDLVAKKNLQSSISEAYGPHGLGILLVKNAPGMGEKRDRLLNVARAVAHLPDEIQSSLEHSESSYSVGWSHGKEKLARGQPDFSKGSYYNNPLMDDPTGDEELINEWPSFYYPNVWPTTDLLPDLRPAFMEMGQLIHGVGKLIAYQMDEFVTNVRQNYAANTIAEVVATDIPKARLLYYYSRDEMQSFWDSHPQLIPKDEQLSTHTDRDDSWCGWHNDHSSLTGLALGMFFDSNGDKLGEMRDSRAGLYVKTRRNEAVRLHLSEQLCSTHLGFQIGETSQILSGGALKATPHAVAGAVDPQYDSISRASFAVFMQPKHDHHMLAPDGVALNEVQFDRFLPDNVPPLAQRWSNQTDDTFGQFTQRTLAGYY